MTRKTTFALIYSHFYLCTAIGGEGQNPAELQSNRDTKFLPDPQPLAFERTAAVWRLTEEERMREMNSPLEEEAVN